MAKLDYNTALTVQARLEQDGAKRLSSGELAMNIPAALQGLIPPASDNNSKSLNINIEKQVWTYHAGNRSGTLADIAEAYGISSNGKSAAIKQDPIKHDRHTYAKAHGVSWDVYEAAGWEVQQNNDGEDYALVWNVANPNDATKPQKRRRFLNPGGGKRFTSETGYKRNFYGLYRALELSKTWLVVCNGETSVVPAQHFGVPAFCMAGGESAFPPELMETLTETLAAYKRKQEPRTVLIALDCDDKGRAVSKKLLEQFSEAGIAASVVDLGLGEKQDLGDFVALCGDNSLEELIKRKKGRSKADAAALTVDSKAGMQDVLALLDPKHIDRTPFVEFPFQSFHFLGGNCWQLKPRKLVYIIARTGGGKTSFMETIADKFLLQKKHVLFWGEEWSWREYMLRRIQRNYGINSNMFTAWSQWKREEEDGVDLHRRRGLDLPLWLGRQTGKFDNDTVAATNYGLRQLLQITNWLKAVDSEDGWNDKFHLFEGYSSLDELLAAMEITIDSIQQKGEEIAGVFFDYVQLLPDTKAESQRGQYEARLERIKSFVQRTNVVGWVGSQINKAPSNEQREKNVLLDDTDANYITTTAANLVLTLNPLFIKDEDQSTDEAPVYVRYADGRSKIYVSKNSDGKTYVSVPMVFEGARLRWREPSGYNGKN